MAITIFNLSGIHVLSNLMICTKLCSNGNDVEVGIDNESRILFPND